jgi:hypothetical protein
VAGGILLDPYGPRVTMGAIAAWIGAMALASACSGIRPLRD